MRLPTFSHRRYQIIIRVPRASYTRTCTCCHGVTAIYHYHTGTEPCNCTNPCIFVTVMQRISAALSTTRSIPFPIRSLDHIHKKILIWSGRLQMKTLSTLLRRSAMQNPSCDYPRRSEYQQTSQSILRYRQSLSLGPSKSLEVQRGHLPLN